MHFAPLHTNQCGRVGVGLLSLTFLSAPDTMLTLCVILCDERPPAPEATMPLHPSTAHPRTPVVCCLYITLNSIYFYSNEAAVIIFIPVESCSRSRARSANSVSQCGCLFVCAWCNDNVDLNDCFRALISIVSVSASLGKICVILKV